MIQESPDCFLSSCLSSSLPDDVLLARILNLEQTELSHVLLQSNSQRVPLHSSQNPWIYRYAQELENYFLGLKSVDTSRDPDLPSGPLDPEAWSQALIQLRWKIKLKGLTDFEASQLLQWCGTWGPSPLSDNPPSSHPPSEGFNGKLECLLWAESWFVLAQGLEKKDDFLRATQCYLNASRLYRAHQVPKKSLRSELNSISSDSHRDLRNRKHIGLYLNLAERCKQEGVGSLAGLCYTNIAAEFLSMASPAAALNYAHKGVQLLQKEYGSRHADLALIQRAEIYIQLNQQARALVDLREVETSPHPEVQAALRVLECKYHPLLQGQSLESTEQQKSEIQWSSLRKVKMEETLVPTWREKFKAYFESIGILDSTSILLSPLEEKILELLMSGAKSKDQLISEIYKGERSSWQSLENRFYVLLTRFRRKHPHLVKQDKGIYSLFDLPVEGEL